VRVVSSIDEMQSLSRDLSNQGKTIGLVPTMGYLHEGHLSLIELLKDRCDFIILSIFVNPTQFGIEEDLEKYPRDLNRDLELCKEREVDLVFAPEDAEMYPPEYSTFVQEEDVGTGLCGVSRPTHFRGVTTVCAKLFNLCNPDFVALGQKDAQQIAVLKRMIRDLDFPIEVVVGPIVREPDGLAMSSRNQYLDPKQRDAALVLYESMLAGRKIVEEKGVMNTERVKAEVMSILTKKTVIRVNYVEIVDGSSMRPEREVQPGHSMIVVAVWLNEVRLIDNLAL
jgi:pantoate--beta-alanine ligase